MFKDTFKRQARDHVQHSGQTKYHETWCIAREAQQNFSSLVDWLQDGRGSRLVQLQLMVHLVRGASAIIEPVSQHILEDHALKLGLQLIAHDPV